MAAMSTAAKEAKLRTLEAPACPLCGEPMEATGTGWFCYSGPDGKCPKMGALAERMYAEAPLDYIQGVHALDPFQGQTFAAIVAPGDPPQILARFGSVRGGRGLTNLRIWSDRCSDEEIPGLVRQYGWTWCDRAAPPARRAESGEEE